MTGTLNIAIAQLNPVVADISGNVEKILAARDDAVDDTDIIVYTELVVSGYPPEDLVLKPFFIELVREAVEKLAARSKDGPAMLISAPWREDDKVYNAALLLRDGEIAAKRFKHHLPNYGVFDEMRVFDAGPLPEPVEFKGVKLGVMTCEDMWYADVAEHLAEQGAEIFLIPNGSPFEIDKPGVRSRHARERIAATGLPIVYANQVGGQDELVFDGACFVMDHEGEIVAHAPPYETFVMPTRWEKTGDTWICVENGGTQETPGLTEQVYRTLMLGLRDYVDKNGFPGVVLGMSGGIDSALSAAIAADALGPERVRCIMMPSPYTSQDSLDDAAQCSELLGVTYDSVSIGPAMAAFDEMLAPLCNGTPGGVTAENVQARSRGLTLMAVSNDTGYMVLSTGNKSEMSVGYATLYGDMCGGYSVLKDVYKMMVYKLSNWRNQNQPKGALGPAGRAIPERIITKAPTAELRPDQKDEDSLPPYEKLDDILECLIEREMGIDEITARGHDAETVNKVWRLLDRAEYKRRQAPPGVKISSKAFGRDRRYPITNRFVDLLKSA